MWCWPHVRSPGFNEGRDLGKEHIFVRRADNEPIGHPREKKESLCVLFARTKYSLKEVDYELRAYCLQGQNIVYRT